MDRPFVYLGVGTVVPAGVTRVRVDPSVAVIPPEAFASRFLLEELELCDGLREIGRRAFVGCTRLRFKDGTNVPSTVSVVCDEAFMGCRSLGEVVVPRGVQTIGRGTFKDCASMTRCVVPATVRIIRSDAFISAPFARADLPDSIEAIGDKAFKDCRFGKVRVPPQVSTIGRHLFYSCRRMFSLELPEGVGRIKNYAFMDCVALRNVVIPPNAGRGGLECFHECDDLFELFGSNKGVKDALRGRFRRLPFHRICYYQSYHDTRMTIGRLVMANSTAPDTSVGDKDCLGMTPLHILACSKRQDYDLYKFLHENFGPRMRRYSTTEDRWGCLPLFYALLGDVPPRIRDFFVNELARSSPGYFVDTRRFVENLCRCGASLDAVEYVFGGTRGDMFPVKSVDWDQFVGDLAASASAERVPVEVFRYLIRLTISDRVDNIRVEKWRAAIWDEVENLPDGGKMRNTELKGIRLKLAFAEYTYDHLKEAAFLLELALWKARVDECSSWGKKRRSARDDFNPKRAKIDKVGFMYQCRINCGAEVIIRGVLPFLIENMI
ncbi:hypothetical protein ACHAW5_004279 [Stephanodiscus triporus]|uniref:Uncharacterized protein n=1 Tax=Stephanodiscus triporus TaxID=2934178 RepID=A0ABD3MLW2_9STRA